MTNERLARSPDDGSLLVSMEKAYRKLGDLDRLSERGC